MKPLRIVIVGSGFLKANISVMVGQLYPRTDIRRDPAYTIFYMGINFGAVFAPITFSRRRASVKRVAVSIAMRGTAPMSRLSRKVATASKWIWLAASTRGCSSTIA